MSFETDDTTEEHERRITRCRSCRARIIFLSTSNDKQMPIDVDTVEPDDDEFDADRHVSHFRTCPNAQKHRRDR